MSKTTTVTHQANCDGCGIVAPSGLGLASGWIVIQARSGFANRQQQISGGCDDDAKLAVMTAAGSPPFSADRLDYCSAECAAKHLSGTGKG